MNQFIRYWLCSIILICSVNTYIQSQDYSCSANLNYRITPIYFSSEGRPSTFNEFDPYQNQDGHLSGQSVSLKFKYVFSKKHRFQLLFETSFRYDHHYFEYNEFPNDNYGPSKNTGLSDFSLGFGKSLYYKSIDDRIREISLILSYGLYNRGSEFVKNGANGFRTFDNYHYNPFVLSSEFRHNSFIVGLTFVVNPDKETFDIVDEAFVIPQISIGYLFLD